MNLRRAKKLCHFYGPPGTRQRIDATASTNLKMLESEIKSD